VLKKYSLTEDHRAQLKPWADRWIANALSTKPMDDEDRLAMTDAIHGLYEAAGLSSPTNIVFVPSPLVGQVASGFAAAIWHARDAGRCGGYAIPACLWSREPKCPVAIDHAIGDAIRDNTYSTTYVATEAATEAATYIATVRAIDLGAVAASEAAIRNATRDAAHAAAIAATYFATSVATRDATDAATSAAISGATISVTHRATQDAIDAATRDATDLATRAATEAATHDATSAATSAAISEATRAATIRVTHRATRVATNVATSSATRDAIDASTWEATDEATRAATDDVAYHVIDAATRKATSVATHEATLDVTNPAIESATRDATDDSIRVAISVATRDATSGATRAATDVATDLATYAATDLATGAATYAATRNATEEATRDAISAATRDATRDATSVATRVATSVAARDVVDGDVDGDVDDATDLATRAATDAATDAATRDEKGWAVRLSIEIGGADLSEMMLSCARSSWKMYQGGNMWSSFECFLSFFRHVVKLDLPEYETYRHWESAAQHGGFRWMHAKFCIVSDRPRVLRIDPQNRPHCADGPSHLWSDGLAIYYWHGYRIPPSHEWIISDPSRLTVQASLAEPNAELRRIMLEKLGFDRVAEELGASVVDQDINCGQPRRLLEATIDGERLRILHVVNGTVEPDGTRRSFHLGALSSAKTAHEAVALSYGRNPSNYAEAGRT
jgi:hypothetical protein